MPEKSVKTKPAKVTVRVLKPADSTLAAQAAEIIAVLVENGGTMTRKDLVTALKSRMKTKQPPGRVLSFYRPQLERDKYIVVEKANIASPAV